MANQAMLTRAVLEKCVKSYKYDKAFFFKLPSQLKPKQITNAIKRFAPGIKESDVVAVMDTTLFDSGKDGYLLTETHMYGKSLEGKTIDLNRMSKLNRKDSYLTVTYPDGKADRLFVSIFDQDLFNLLKMIMDESAKLINAQQDLLDNLAAAAREAGKAAQAKLSEENIQLVEEESLPEVLPDPGPLPGIDSEVAEEESGVVPTPAFDPIDEPDEEPAPDPAPKADAEALFREGRKKFMAKDYGGAVAAFQQAADMGHQQAAQFLAQLKAIVGNKAE